MRISQVNLGRSQMITSSGKSYATGIYKSRIDGSVAVGTLGLTDDVICDGKFHGGPDQALYLYSIEDYGFWSDQLGEDVAPGSFGENLTTTGLDLCSLFVGDILISENLTLQVTAPRIPCNTLEARMGKRGFAKQFMKAGRSGAYCRVLKEGRVSACDEFELETYKGNSILLTTFLTDAHRKLPVEKLKRYLSLPIDQRSRADFEKKIVIKS